MDSVKPTKGAKAPFTPIDCGKTILIIQPSVPGKSLDRARVDYSFAEAVADGFSQHIILYNLCKTN